MELFRALATLAEPPSEEHARLASLLDLPGPPTPAEYSEVFLFQLYPYASVYLGEEGMLGGEAQDRVAGMWRALKQTPPAEPDHLATLLALYAAIVEAHEAEADPARRLLWGQTRKACLWEHLACWLFPYLDRLDEIAPPAYRAWGRLLHDALAAEISEVGQADSLPLHLRQAPALPHPDDHGPDAFLRGLLAPVRSGLIVVRADLARAARQVELGLRLGERAFVLRALLVQNPPAMLHWLARYAWDAAARHRSLTIATSAVGRFWADRAETTAKMLQELRDHAAREHGQATWSATAEFVGQGGLQ